MRPGVDGDGRKVMVRRFPYAMLFRERGEVVEVLAVFHGFRDPTQWRERTAGSSTRQGDNE